jgi:hypothetical protein
MSRRTVGGRHVSRRLPRDEWQTLIRDAHPGYISWDHYEKNLRRLHENAQAHGKERRKSPPREGPALLQGLVICGRCGERMSVRYRDHHGEILPEYVCQKQRVEKGEPRCQWLLGGELDRAIGELLVETVSPLALEIALAIQDELRARTDEADRLRRQQVERARYEAELAQRRYLRVDPDNRLVAGSLEADWNEKLRALTAAQEEYERQRQAEDLLLNEEKRAQILALATDFPRLWHDPATPRRERKRMVRLLIEDVTLLRGEGLMAHVRFTGGATRTITLPLPLPASQLRKTPVEVVEEIDRLLEEHTDGQVAEILNASGFRPGVACRFSRLIIRHIRSCYGLEDHATRLRRRGLKTVQEMAAQLGVCTATVKDWRRAGLLRSYLSGDNGEQLYEPPGKDAPIKWKHKLKGGRPPEVLTDVTNEVQSDA